MARKVLSRENCPTNVFGKEVIDCVIGKMSASQILTLIKFPEQALCRDIPSLFLFNVDDPSNHTVTFSGMGLRGYKSSGWKSVNEFDVLKVMGLHYSKVLEYAKGVPEIHNNLSCMDYLKAGEYCKVAISGTTITVSAFCPIYHSIDSNGIISAEDMAAFLKQTILDISRIGKDRWLRTSAYLEEMF